VRPVSGTLANRRDEWRRIVPFGRLSVFAAVVGVPAGEYPTHWRMGVAQGMLGRGRPVKQVAVEVGDAGAATFGRAFAQAVGVPPTTWLGRQRR
jgi:transcriptional regulator GlxA family with amidase domain